MSAIFGVYNRDGKPVAHRVLSSMSATLAHRGPDADGVWHNGAVGIGHRMLRTTPESFNEKLPCPYSGSDVVITADARIDNREELLEVLKPEVHCPSGRITDSAIIVESYLRWGEDCASYLLGDFAFVIWDERNQKLFCARDHFGVKPFYYFGSEALFAFATETKALFEIPDIPVRLNEGMIADYLISNFEDKATTFYEDILRLPPAHTLTVSAENFSLRSFYELDPERESAVRSDKEYAEGLREVFTEAVRCRMRSEEPVGSLLSGGLDSSSIACVARDLLREQGRDEPLPTFSLVYDRVIECDEQRYINLVLAQGGFRSHFVPGDKDTPLTNLASICRDTDRPSIGPGFSASLGLYEKIAATGIKVVFDGHDGDSAVSYGYKYLDELARDGRWIALAAEARAVAPVFEVPSWKIFQAYAKRYRWKPFVKKHPGIKRIARLAARLRQGAPESPNGFAEMAALVNKSFAARVDLVERYRLFRGSQRPVTRTARSDHHKMITTGGQALALEESDAITAAFGLEKRYPFWDKRLIEYCLSLPGDQKYKDGWNRVVMRRAMTGILPTEVCWRKVKTDFSANFIDGLVNNRREQLSFLLVSKDGILGEYFDRDALRAKYQRLNSIEPNDGNSNAGRDLRLVWEIAALISWLRQFQGYGRRG